MSLNKIMVQGNFTRDVEMRNTQSGSAVGSFAIAVQRDFPNKQTGQKEVDFFEVTVFNKNAEFVSKYFSKGSQAVVEGSMQIENWNDKDGNKRTTPRIIANNVYFCGSKQDSKSNGNYNSTHTAQNAPQQHNTQQTSGYGYQNNQPTQAQQTTHGNWSELNSDGQLPF